MNSTQAFLIEVIVDRLDVRENPKNRQKAVGFNSKGRASSGMTGLMGAPTDSKMFTNVLGSESTRLSGVGGPPCSVIISFSDFEPIIINEDLTPEWEREKSKEVKEEINKEGKSEEATAEREMEEKRQARAAGLSPKEYQDTKKKNPDMLTEKRFTIGKSTLIRMQPTEMIELLKTEKLSIQVDGGSTYSLNLGTATVEFPANFIEAVVTAAYSSAMRDMIAREGHIWWPKQLYRTVMIKEVKEAQKQLALKKSLEFSQEEKDLAVRFKNLCELDPIPPPCPICEADEDECHRKPLTYKDIAPPNPPKKKRVKIDKKGQAWLMYPSPDPIQPPPLPTTAQMTEVVDVIDDSKKPTAILSLYVRLSCFGIALELNRREEPFPFPD
uniref:Uncharacterized protein n=2 Tax=Lygus hesperus TaxID=30085 RepID=A0A0K8SWF6_LYGHE